MRTMIIDTHTHAFPPSIAKRAISGVKGLAGVSNYSDGTVSGLESSMAEAGITISFISRIAVRPEQVTQVNSWLLEICNEKLEVFATIHPDMDIQSDLVAGLQKNGYKGIKVHPDYQGFYVDEKRMYPFYEAAQSCGFPILFHAGTDRGLPSPVHALPKHFAKVRNDFPDLKMIAAHMGGEGNYEETKRLLLGEDIYLDTSFVFRLMDLSTIKEFFRKHPVERFLFGSDSPWKDQKQELDYLLSLSFLSDDKKEKIIGLNARELFKL